jgi:hypothetical protein
VEHADVPERAAVASAMGGEQGGSRSWGGGRGERVLECSGGGGSSLHQKPI